MNNKLWRTAGQTFRKATICGCLAALTTQGMAQIKSAAEETCAANSFQLPGQEYAIGGTAGEISAAYGQKPYQPDMNMLFPSSDGTGKFSKYADTPAKTAVDILVIDSDDPIPVIVSLSRSTTTIAYLRHGQLVVAHIRTLLESAGYKSKWPYWLSYSNGDRRINIILRKPESANITAAHVKSQSIINTSEIIGAKNVSAVVLPNSFTGLPILPYTSSLIDMELPRTLQLDYSVSRFLFNFATLPSLEKSLAEYYSRKISYNTPNRPVQSSPAPITGKTRSPNLILNMSLAIISCNILNKYTEERNKKDVGLGITYTLKEYFKDYARSHNESLDNVQKQFIEVPGASPFMKRMAEYLAPVPNARNIAVAASGNYGLDYSTAPGSSPNVISVGARTVRWEQPGPPYWSNRSDVLSMGVGFTLTPDQIKRLCDEGGTCIAADIKPNTSIPDLYRNFVYNGTSFAAPSVSAFLATRIGDDPCFNNAEPVGFKPIQSKSQKFEFRGDWIYQPCDSENLIPPLKPVPQTPTPSR